MPYSMTFVGTATTLLRLGSFTLLTDPNFLHRGQRAYLGKGLWSRRLTDPALAIGELPALDAVLLSHLHGDHFDRVARRGLDRGVPILSTPAAARRLEQWGFTAEGLRTWEQRTLTRTQETLTIESLPGIHGRGVMKALLPPVMGSLLTHEVAGRRTVRIYVTGDTLMGDHVEEIARRCPDVDLALVHLGGTRVLLHTVTMDAQEGLALLQTVRPQRAVPIHYDDYRVFRSPLSDFLEQTGRAGLSGAVQVVPRGRTVDLADVLDRPLPGGRTDLA